MTYVRHRDRMVQESVFEDLQNSLIAFRWMSGTTTRPVIDPEDPAAGWQTVTTEDSEVLKLAGHRENGDIAQVVLIDYFPEAGGGDDGENPEGEIRSRKTEPNTLAIDTGQPGEPEDVELGSNMKLQPYAFTIAFYASSDAVALAVLNDLRDRFEGRAITDDHIDLYNFNASGFSYSTPAVVRMEIDYFRYSQNVELATPADTHLYYAELGISDIVDPSESFRSISTPISTPEPLEGDLVIVSPAEQQQLRQVLSVYSTSTAITDSNPGEGIFIKGSEGGLALGEYLCTRTGLYMVSVDWSMNAYPNRLSPGEYGFAVHTMDYSTSFSYRARALDSYTGPRDEQTAYGSEFYAGLSLNTSSTVMIHQGEILSVLGLSFQTSPGDDPVDTGQVNVRVIPQLLEPA